MVAMKFKCTQYFTTVRTRCDRAMIEDEWILRTIQSPDHEAIQADGRIRLGSVLKKGKVDIFVLSFYQMGKQCIMLFLIAGLRYES